MLPKLLPPAVAALDIYFKTMNKVYNSQNKIITVWGRCCCSTSRPANTTNAQKLYEAGFRQEVATHVAAKTLAVHEAEAVFATELSHLTRHATRDAQLFARALVLEDAVLTTNLSEFALRLIVTEPQPTATAAALLHAQTLAELRGSATSFLAADLGESSITRCVNAKDFRIFNAQRSEESWRQSRSTTTEIC
jgi:hypothetical protein